MATDPLEIGAFVFGVVGILVAIIIYFRSKKFRKPVYTTNSNNLFSDISGKIEALRISYGERPISNLTVTKIFFWNSGNETINRSDVASTEPIKISAHEGVDILESKILYQKNEANLFKLVPSETDRGIVGIDFEYIDHDEGVVIQVPHTGKTGSDIEVVGKVKGAGSPIRKDFPDVTSGKTRRNNMIAGVLLIILATAVFLFTLTQPVQVVTTTSDSNPADAGLVVMGAGIAAGLLAINRSRRKIPKGFEQHASV